MLTTLYKELLTWDMLNNGMEIEGCDYGYLLWNKKTSEYAYVGWKNNKVQSIEITTILR